MALTEQVIFDIQSAQRQIDSLERQLDGLGTPIDVPVNIDEQDFQKVARALGVSEDEARRLATTVGRSVSEATQLDNELREVARSLGLSEREASDFVRQMRRGEDAAEDTANAMLRVGTRGASAFTNLRGSIVGVVGALGAIQGARALFDFFGEAIESASDLEESTSKVNVVFGEFADEIQAFAATGPQALGLANAAALEFTGTFGNLFVALGLTQREAADLAPEIVQLGADLASFNNIEVTEALDKLRAGLVGEAEPLRALGVNLTAAATAAKAVELGLAGSTTEVSEAAKVQARYALILEQTATAQGDFARTADGIANRQRTLAAEFENTRAAVGEALLPAFEVLLEIAPQITQAIQDGLVPAIASLASTIGSVDTSAITQFLGGAPSAAAQLGTQFGAATQAVGNALQVFGSLAKLDFSQVGIQFGQLGDDIQRFSEAGVAGQALRDLIFTIQQGVEPADALGRVLAALGEDVSSLTLEAFEDLADQLILIAQTAGATPPELFALAATFQDIGEAAGFSAPGVDSLVASLQQPGLVVLADASVGDIIAQNLAGVGEAAAGSAGPVDELGTALQTVADTTVSDALAVITEEFGKLPGAVESARAALQTEEGETVEDAAGFIADLQDELSELENFTADINIARALGLDDTVALAAELGPEFAGVLSQAISDPATAALLESTIEGFAEAEAAFTNQALTTALLDEFSDAIQIPLNIDFQLGNIRFPGAGDLFENLNIGGAGTPPPAPQGPNTGGGVTINQVFPGPVPPTPDLVRAAQSVNQVTQY